jgi:hypothetical protein
MLTKRVVSLFFQNRVNAILKDRWDKLKVDDKEVWRQWTEWDKKRYAREKVVYERARHKTDPVESAHVPKKQKPAATYENALSVPNKQEY